MWWRKMPKKRRTINKASIAVLTTHVEYIREAIDKIDEQLLSHIEWGTSRMSQIDKNFKAMDDRIQKLEDWVAGWEKREETGFKTKSYKLALAGLIISIIMNLVTLVLSAMGYI